MKGSVQWSIVIMSWIQPSVGFKLGTSWSEDRSANHLTTWTLTWSSEMHALKKFDATQAKVRGWPWTLNQLMTITLTWFLCPQLRRSWRGILLLGHSSVCPSVHLSRFLMHSYCFEISYMDSSWKNSWHIFFLDRIMPLSWVMTLWKDTWMQSCQQNNSKTTEARALKLDE